MKITLVHNPGAGYQKLSKESLIDQLQGKGLTIKYISTKEDGLNASLLAHPSDLVIVAGGDGTIRKVAHLLMGKHIPIAIIPLGTANNISASLESSRIVPKSNEEWMNQETGPYDVGRVSFAGEHEFFMESAGCGAIAEMIQRFREQKKNDPPTFDRPQEEIGYIRSFMKEMLDEYQSCEYKVVIDGEAFFGKYLLIEVVNIKSIGPKLRLAPQTEPGDGWLEVVLVQEEDKEALYTHLSTLGAEQAAMPAFTVKRGKKISIVTDRSRFHVDDEVLSSDTASSDASLHLDIKVDNNCLSLFKNWFTLPEVQTEG